MVNDSGPPHPTRRRFVQATIAGALLAGCGGGGSSDQHPRFVTRRASYDEPFDVGLVKESKIPPEFRPRVVPAPSSEVPGTVIVDTSDRFLYLIQPDNKALRYGVAVGKAGFAWSGKATIARKAEWPAWHPTPRMRSFAPDFPHYVAPGPANPLGARALYLYANGRDTLYRIHGTNAPWTIGTYASSGCIRMLNEDIIDLYDRVATNSAVIVK